MSIQKIVIRQYNTNPLDRPQPLLQLHHHSSKHRFAEFAGGATAECAVVCCCFPLSLVNLIVLAVYGVPAGLYRKALNRRRRRRLLKKGTPVDGGDVDGDRSSCEGSELEVFVMRPMEVDSDVIELENEMWDRFYGTGFWRSGSGRVE